MFLGALDRSSTTSPRSILTSQRIAPYPRQNTSMTYVVLRLFIVKKKKENNIFRDRAATSTVSRCRVPVDYQMDAASSSSSNTHTHTHTKKLLQLSKRCV